MKNIRCGFVYCLDMNFVYYSKINNHEIEDMYCLDPKTNIVYVTSCRNPRLYDQTTIHAKFQVHNDVAFLLDIDTFEHTIFGDIQTYHHKKVNREYLEDMKPQGVTTIYDLDRCFEAYILTKRIFHKVVNNLKATFLETKLPNDVIDIITDMDLANHGLSLSLYLYLSNSKETKEFRPFKVKHMNGFTRRPRYRVVLAECVETSSLPIWSDDMDDLERADYFARASIHWYDIPDVMEEDDEVDVL